LCHFTLSALVLFLLTSTFVQFTPCHSVHQTFIASKPDYVYDYNLKEIAGFNVQGNAYGSLIFEQSKLKKDFKVEVDTSLSSPELKDDIEWNIKDNIVTMVLPKEGSVNITAKVVLPSGIVGSSRLPGFSVAVPFRVDYSALGHGVEMTSFDINVAKGCVGVGDIATNVTTIHVANGGCWGKLQLARNTTTIDLANGGACIKTTPSSDGIGELSIKAGNGNITGHYIVEKETSLTAAKGDVKVSVQIEDTPADIVPTLSTSTGSGFTRVNVERINKDSLVSSTHNSISGSHCISLPKSFLGTITARNVVGNITLVGKDLVVEKHWYGYQATKGNTDEAIGAISIRSVRGNIRVSVRD